MKDPTENIRKKMCQEINEFPKNRQELIEKYGQVWDTQELSEAFIIEGFAAPLIIVKRKSDSIKGSMLFQHYPRFYFDFREEIKHV